MIELRHAGLAICAVLSIAFVIGGREPARAQTAAPAQVPARAAAPAQVPAPAAASAPAKPDACPRDKFRVVVDVGHTLDVPGAMSARGVPEYAFNLQLGQDADKALIDAGFGQTVLLITKTAPWLGLIERAQRANAMHADLFIALHHDSVPDNLMHPWQYNGQDQGYNDDYPGYAIFISNDNADRAGSLKFGSLLGKELQARGLQYTPHYTLALMGHHRRDLVDAKAGVYRFNELLVLRETHMPAVLLEAGSIVNRQEELQLATPERRALTSAAIVAAVDEFCGSRAHPPTAKR
jgi:N-acetylmuramoyl-L-alanine amidase